MIPALLYRTIVEGIRPGGHYGISGGAVIRKELAQ